MHVTCITKVIYLIFVFWEFSDCLVSATECRKEVRVKCDPTDEHSCVQLCKNALKFSFDYVWSFCNGDNPDSTYCVCSYHC